MKLLFFIHDISGGGAERVLVNLANAFVEQDNDILIATNIKQPFAYSLNQKVRTINLYDRYSKGNGLLNKIYNALTIRRNIRKYVNQERPDVVIAFGAALGCMVVASTIGLSTPVVVSEHTNVSRNLGCILNIKRNILYPLANSITLLTRHDYNCWKGKFRNVVYMPNPISLQSVDVSRPRKKVVLAVGRVNQWHIKGFDNLIRCWANLWQDFPEWTLLIAGDANVESKRFIVELIEKNKCKNVELLGFRNDINDLMLNSEIFCLSSRVEGLPMVLIEAMNAGCCCVSFDVVTGPREIIIDERSGLIAKNQDNEDLTAKLRLVMSDEELRHKLASNTRNSIQKYSIDRIIERWNILFRKVCKK